MVSWKSSFILSLSAIFSSDSTEGPPSVGVAKVVFWKHEPSEKKMVPLTVRIRDGRVFIKNPLISRGFSCYAKIKDFTVLAIASNISIKINGFKYQVLEISSPVAFTGGSRSSFALLGQGGVLYFLS